MEGVIGLIEGNNNIANTGYINGDCITGSKETIININIMDTKQILEKLSETVEALNNISKSQIILSEAILKQKDNDGKQADAFVILARAAENNSLANLNLSQSLLRDKDIVERLINILEECKK